MKTPADEYADAAQPVVDWSKHKTIESKIVTSHVFPPIPIRDFDWCAFREGREEDGNYGYGRTEQEAIADLLERESEQ